MSIWPTEAGLLRQRIAELEAECDQWQKKLTEDAWPEIERLRALNERLRQSGFAEAEKLEPLMAENERLGRAEEVALELAEVNSQHNLTLTAENEQLRQVGADYVRVMTERDALRVENLWLRAALERYRAGEIECPICELWHQPGTCMEVHD